MKQENGSTIPRFCLLQDAFFMALCTGLGAYLRHSDDILQFMIALGQARTE